MPDLTQELTAPRQQGANPHARYYPALDGLRAVAVLLVFSVHYLQFTWGWVGVDIFFVLSGFLITGILYDGQNQPRRFRNFYLRRALRIFPLYNVVWLAFLIASPIIGIHWKLPNLLWPVYLGNWIPFLYPARVAADPLLFHLAAYPSHFHIAVVPFVLNTGHFWSLCVEEQFYFLWPLLVFTIRKRTTLLTVCVAAVVASPLLRIAAMHFLAPRFTDVGALHNCTFLRLDEFLVGGFAALVLRGPHAARLRSAGKILLACGLAAIALSSVAAVRWLNVQTSASVNMRWTLSCGITFVDIAALGLILLCLDPRSWFGWLMNLRPLCALGRISYGFYIFHEILHSAYNHCNKSFHIRGDAASAVIPLLGTLALAALSYRFLETPFLRLKTRFEGHGGVRENVETPAPAR